MTTPLAIAVRDLAPGARLLALSGRLDARTYMRLDEAVADAASAGATRLVIDVAGVGHLSAAGAGAFLSAQSVMRGLGGDVALTGVGEELSETLDLLDLAKEFPVGDTPEAALARLPGGAAL